MKNFITGLSHQALNVSDLSRAKSFYQDVLGLPLLYEDAAHVFLKVGEDAHFGILALLAAPPEGMLPPENPRLRVGNKYTHFGFRAQSERDVFEFAEYLAQKNVEIIKGPYARSDGASVYFLDADGHTLEYLYLKPEADTTLQSPSTHQSAPVLWHRYQKYILGFSYLGRPIEAHVFLSAAALNKKSSRPKPAVTAELNNVELQQKWFDDHGPWLLMLGAVHGNEVEGEWLLSDAIEKYKNEYIGKNISLVVVTALNVDGWLAGSRLNARGIDLNRNLPTQDFTTTIKNPKYPPGPSACSEVENQLLVRLIDQLKPKAILSAHSFSEVQVNSNGPSEAWAQELAAITQYPVTTDIGYPTPGALGTYAGKERNIPTITLEIKRGLSKEEVLKGLGAVCDQSIKFFDK